MARLSGATAKKYNPALQAEGIRSDYDSVIVSYSDGIDSTGALHWALKNFDAAKIWLLYCDTGCEYPENEKIFLRVAKTLNLKHILLKNPKGLLGLLMEERYKWPDMKNRWCTAYLKTSMTDKWIRSHRHLLGKSCLFLSGERRDESPGRAKLPELEYHATTLFTKRKGDFTCHWYRPCLDCEKGQMFAWGKDLKLEPHPCYQYVGRCSCMFCMFMPDAHAMENIRRHPQLAAEFVKAEMKTHHTWKQGKSLASLYAQCYDIDDIVETTSTCPLMDKFFPLSGLHGPGFEQPQLQLIP